ncbi:MAG: hypothetical protein MUP85_13315 [Candidatus Lokiarchaeota archaeon]|nr:hypothetical protein [Candidatus Lokiarchaeota archaeon]MCJ7649588.1 hypothetical protein [Candidatus Lokiarchaeota archaeon]
MEKRNLGYFLLVIGFIFLIISFMTIWALTINWVPSNGIYLLFTIPLLIFSTSTLISAVFLIYQDHLNNIIKGLILILDGLIPTFTPIYALFDPRLQPFSDIRGMVLIPLFLVGVFIIIYGIGWLVIDKYVTIKLRKKLNKILGSISIGIGTLNSIFFIVVLNYDASQPLLVTWLLVGAILIVFGIILVFKKVESAKIQSRRKKR